MASGRLTTLDELTTTRQPGLRALTVEEKRALYRDGYIILKGAVSKEVTRAAKQRIEAAKNPGSLASARELTDLVNQSNITPILNDLIGHFDPPSLCQVGILPPRKPSKAFTPAGYRDNNMPYFGASMHIDGSCTIFSGIPQNPKMAEGWTPEQKYRHYINAGKDPFEKGKGLNEGKAPEARHGKPQVGESCKILGENGGVPLFNDADCTLGLGSFTSFLFVALNDQMKPGCGQTALLKGSHHAAEKFFQMQQAAGGIMGIEGPGWERINCEAENGLGINYLPKPVWDEFTDESKYGPLERSSDGVVWPRPVQMLMEEGDACLTVFHVAHSGTRNEFGSEPRQNIIFRIRAKAHNPNVVVNGVSDHLDRGQWGQWLDPKRKFHKANNFVDHSKDLEKEWFDPFERSRHLLCHPWEVWPGMREIVAEERRQESAPERAAPPRSRL